MADARCIWLARDGHESFVEADVPCIWPTATSHSSFVKSTMISMQACLKSTVFQIIAGEMYAYHWHSWGYWVLYVSITNLVISSKDCHNCAVMVTVAESSHCRLLRHQDLALSDQLGEDQINPPSCVQVSDIECTRKYSSVIVNNSLHSSVNRAFQVSLYVFMILQRLRCDPFQMYSPGFAFGRTQTLQTVAFIFYYHLQTLLNFK